MGGGGVVSGNTSLSISNSSGVGLSEKFGQLERLSLCLTSATSQGLMNILFSSTFSRYKSCPYDSDNQETQ